MQKVNALTEDQEQVLHFDIPAKRACTAIRAIACFKPFATVSHTSRAGRVALRSFLNHLLKLDIRTRVNHPCETHRIVSPHSSLPQQSGIPHDSKLKWAKHNAAIAIEPYANEVYLVHADCVFQWGTGWSSRRLWAYDERRAPSARNCSGLSTQSQCR